ncbi:unnamed protein product [Coregonus sp. 'balchen']|nr:unnamed protein product [Coregonus sp. 'balchen']
MHSAPLEVKDYNGQKINVSVAKKNRNDKKRRTTDGKMRGFAFVQFKNVLGAGKALNAINLKEIKGRQVAVDWAVAKDKFVATQPGAKKEEKVAAEKAAPESDSEEEAEEEEVEEEKKPLEHSKNKVRSKPAQQPDSPSEDESEEGEGDDEENEEAESQEADDDNKSDLGSDEDDDDDCEDSGIAFAQFKSKEAAEKCIIAAEDESESGGIHVDGRKLNIVAAVSREDAVKRKDKKFEDLKRTKLRDMNVFVSKNRLCVHNLPKSVDSKQLQQLCLKAAGAGKGVLITECRVMYDKKPERGQVLGRSLGYGFVQFQDHEHALKTLRHLNNNPDIYGNTKRPIVEFSLEDGRKLKMKEMRQQQVKYLPPQPQAKAQTQQQAQKQGRQYAGFQTTPVLEHSAKGAKRRFRSREDDRFDNLVEQYKRKLMGGNKTATIKKNKWFNS